MDNIDNIIRLEKDDVLRLKLVDDKGKETGEYLEFDLEDIDLKTKYYELLDKDKKNRKWMQDELVIIKKRQDVKGEKMPSKNEEDELKAAKKFFEKEVEIYNMFLGENGVQKILNGRKLGWASLIKINKLIDQQILPLLEKKSIEIQNKYKEIVKDKYTFDYKEEL